MKSVNHTYAIKIYVLGHVVREYSPSTYEEAQKIYFRTFNSIECYTQLIVDGKEYTTDEASKFLDPTYRLRNTIRNSRGFSHV